METIQGEKMTSKIEKLYVRQYNKFDKLWKKYKELDKRQRVATNKMYKVKYKANDEFYKMSSMFWRLPREIRDKYVKNIDRK